jgi:hypothetical protein
VVFRGTPTKLNLNSNMSSISYKQTTLMDSFVQYKSMFFVLSASGRLLDYDRHPRVQLRGSARIQRPVLQQDLVNQI